MSLTNLQVLDDTGADSVFKQKRFDILSWLEGNKPTPYFDTKGIITIGIGFNIDTVKNNRTDVMRAMGLSDAQQTAIHALWNSEALNTIRNCYAPGTAQNQMLVDLFAQTIGTTTFAMTDPQIKEVFDVLVLEHQNKITPLVSPPLHRTNRPDFVALQRPSWSWPKSRPEHYRSSRSSCGSLVSDSLRA